MTFSLSPRCETANTVPHCFTNNIVGSGAVGSVEPDAHATCSSGSLTVDLPPDFAARRRSLAASTLLYVPSGCRPRMTDVVAQCWQGMARGIDECSQLEEGRSMLLLLPVPPSLGGGQPRCQNASRFGRSAASRTCCRPRSIFCSAADEVRKRQRGSLDDASTQADCARLTATVGPSQGHRWAHLLHALFRGKRAGIGPLLACTMRPSPHRSPGLLNVPRRVHVNKIHAALSAFSLQDLT